MPAGPLNWTFAGSQVPDGQNIHSAGGLPVNAAGSEALIQLPLGRRNIAVAFSSSPSAKTSGRNSTLFLPQTIRYARRSVTLRSCAWRTSWLKPSRDCFNRLLAITPLKLGTASRRIRSNMKMLRAISISVNARNRCTAEVTRLTQNHNRCCGLATSVRPCGIEIPAWPKIALHRKGRSGALAAYRVAERMTNLFNRPRPRRRPRLRIRILVSPRRRSTIKQLVQLAAKKTQSINSSCPASVLRSHRK